MSSNNNRPDGKRDVTLRFLAEPGGCELWW